MRGIILWYNKNRKSIFKILGVIVIAIITLQLIIYIWRKMQTSAPQQVTQSSSSSSSSQYSLNAVTLEDKTSTVTGKNISDGQINMLSTIDDFVMYCNENKINEAYNLLTEECKLQMYPSVQVFYQNYYTPVFQGKQKNVSSENLSGNTYKINYTENALETGILNTENVIQDYITTVKQEDGTTKLNINGYIGKEEINKEKQEANINIKVIEKHAYIDYETYTFEITNNSNNNILINDLNNDKTMYLQDSNDIKYYAYTHAIAKSELEFQSKETKKINIKYYNKYSSRREIKSIVFSNIILNYVEYKNVSQYNNYGMIQIDL